MRVATFVAEQNVTRFRQQLVETADPVTQAILFKLLLQQLELLLSDEQFGKINRDIERLRHLIANQVELIGELRLGGHDLERPVMVLAVLNELMAIYQRHRQRVKAAIASGCAGANPR